jgi:hypothetical protein
VNSFLFYTPQLISPDIALWLMTFSGLHILPNFFFISSNSPQWGQALLIVDTSLSHSDKPFSVWLLWTSDQPGAETPARYHTALRRYYYEVAHCNIFWRPLNPSQLHFFSWTLHVLHLGSLLSRTNNRLSRVQELFCVLINWSFSALCVMLQTISSNWCTVIHVMCCTINLLLHVWVILLFL